MHVKNECPNASMEVVLPVLFENYVRPTDRPTNRPIDGKTGSQESYSFNNSNMYFSNYKRRKYRKFI